MRKVIDATTMTLLEVFEEKDTEKILEKYRLMNNWDNVESDIDGDIILLSDETT